MSAPLKWRDPSDIVHSVDEWVTWSFSVIDRELSDDGDENDEQSVGNLTHETSCGINVLIEDTFVSHSESVSCLQCIAAAKP
jgi:hypothetical protein